MVTGPALGLLELCSIARGIISCDAVVKKAAVELERCGSTHPGKYVILIRGGVEEVYEALAAGREIAAETLVDELFLPNPHEGLLEVLRQPRPRSLEALGVFEAFSVAATVRGADAALKAAEVHPIRIALARDLGGKGYFVMTGKLHDIQAAIEAGVAAVGDGLLAGCEIVANPHEDLAGALE